MFKLKGSPIVTNGVDVVDGSVVTSDFDGVQLDTIIKGIEAHGATPYVYVKDAGQESNYHYNLYIYAKALVKRFRFLLGEISKL